MQAYPRSLVCFTRRKLDYNKELVISLVLGEPELLNVSKITISEMVITVLICGIEDLRKSIKLDSL